MQFQEERTLAVGVEPFPQPMALPGATRGGLAVIAEFASTLGTAIGASGGVVHSLRATFTTTRFCTVSVFLRSIFFTGGASLALGAGWDCVAASNNRALYEGRGAAAATL